MIVRTPSRASRTTASQTRFTFTRCLAFACLVGCARATAQEPGVVPRFGTFEISVQNARTYADPYRDVVFNTQFKSSSGETVDVVGFHDGDATWKARFRPGTTGTWSYASTFSDGSPAL